MGKVKIKRKNSFEHFGLEYLETEMEKHLIRAVVGCDGASRHKPRTCSKEALQKSSYAEATILQSEPDRVGNLYYWLPAALVEMAFKLLRVRISHERTN